MMMMLLTYLELSKLKSSLTRYNLTATTATLSCLSLFHSLDLQ
jgi:hypothetical protein